MKTNIVTSLIAVALLCSCAGPLQDQAITAAVTVGATTGFRFIPAAKRGVIANYAYYVATVLRTVTGNPTADQLTVLINNSIPASVKADVPELLTYLTPIIVTEYQNLYNKYGASGNAKAIQAGLNDIALGIEAAAAPYKSS